MCIALLKMDSARHGEPCRLPRCAGLSFEERIQQNSARKLKEFRDDAEIRWKEARGPPRSAMPLVLTRVFVARDLNRLNLSQKC